MGINILLNLIVVISSDKCIDANNKSVCHYPFNNNNRLVFYNFGLTNDLYTTNYTVVNIIVPFDGFSLAHTGENWINHPPIFFNLLDNNDAVDPFKGQYILIDKVVHKIFDGRDTALDRSVPNSTIYFAGKDGIYTYDWKSMSAVKYGSINDELLAIEKVVGEDKLYILTADHKIYAVHGNGTIKNEVKGIKYAKDFILDLLGAIYFYEEDNKPQVLKQGEIVPHKFDFEFEINSALFARPSLNYDFNGIVFLANGVQYFLVNCSSIEVVPNTGRIEGITAYNADIFFYQFIANDGRIYEHYLLGPKNNSQQKQKYQQHEQKTVKV